MAVRQRIFNSTAPFSGSPKAELKGSYPSSSAPDQETEEEEEEGKDSKMGFAHLLSMSPLINKLLTHGTAEQVGKMPLKTSSFIAQAECETQDSQEFSPSCRERSSVPFPNCFTSSVCSENNNVVYPTSASVQEPSGSSRPLTHKKKNRKRQKRKGRKKVEQKEKKQNRHRLPSGIPEQESGSFLVQILEHLPFESKGELSTSCCSSIESSEEQDRGHPLYSRPIYSTGSSCTPLPWKACEPFSRLHSSVKSYGVEGDSDSHSSVGDCSLALAGLRGNVSQGDRCYAGPFSKDMEREAREEDEEEFSTHDSVCNEGIIFDNDNIQLVDSEYREGRDYVLTKFIKEGSYGEVHSAQDVNTGFKFAVKKMTLKRFSSEEVGAWSALKSPRVVELFGVVREGPNVVLFMEQKSGSLGQLIVERGRLPEDLSLHYISQVLTALEYLVKKKVAHLDIKAENVLLSEDGRDTFLCDFGHAERLDKWGQSISGSSDLKGTETHMAPEIVKGEPRGAKADVWSSCCMFLHMLNGCHPWTRYYTCRLYLKIANEPPPLREIPPDCSLLTAEVIKAGLQKDPFKRASASELKVKTNIALKEVGGVSSPVKGPYTEPLYIANKPPDSLHISNGSVDYEEEQEHQESVQKPSRWMKKLFNENEDLEAESNDTKPHSLRCPQTLSFESNHKRGNNITKVPEHELLKDFYLSSLSQPQSAERQEQLLSGLSSDIYSNWEKLDKKDSGRWSLGPVDDLSSGVFSYNSQSDVQVFSMDLLGHTQLPPPCCFEGVDVYIRNFSRRSIRIRESRRVKVGHIATGISDQISRRVFTLETQQGQHIAHDEEVHESGLELCCVPADDFSPAWKWRIRDGVLETR